MIYHGQERNASASEGGAFCRLGTSRAIASHKRRAGEERKHEQRKMSINTKEETKCVQNVNKNR